VEIKQEPLDVEPDINDSAYCPDNYYPNTEKGGMCEFSAAAAVCVGFTVFCLTHYSLMMILQCSFNHSKVLHLMWLEGVEVRAMDLSSTGSWFGYYSLHCRVHPCRGLRSQVISFAL